MAAVGYELADPQVLQVVDARLDLRPQLGLLLREPVAHPLDLGLGGKALLLHLLFALGCLRGYRLGFLTIPGGGCRLSMTVLGTAVGGRFGGQVHGFGVAHLVGDGSRAVQAQVDLLDGDFQRSPALLDLLLQLAALLLDGQLPCLVVDGDHDVLGEVQDPLQVPGGEVQQQSQTAGSALAEPDVGHGRGQVDVAHALPAHLGPGHLDAAAVAHDAPVADALVLSAEALPVLGGTEDALAEEAVLLGAQGAVVDGLGLGDLPVGPATDLLWGRYGDSNGVEAGGLGPYPIGHVHTVFTYSLSSTRSGSGRSRPRGIRSSSLRSSTARPRLCSSLRSTLKDSGTPGWTMSSPLTMAS